MKPQQKNTPKMAMGGMVGHPANSNRDKPRMGGRSRGPQSVQAMTAQSPAGARREQRKYS